MPRKLSLSLVACFAVLFPALALGQGALIPPQTAFKVVNGITSPLPFATITVCPANTGGIPCTPATVSIYQDAALTEPLTNPFTADAFGNYQFAAASGTYTVTVTGSGFNGFSYQISTAGGSSGGSSITLQTGGVNNSLQNLLNIAAGAGISVANTPGTGKVTITNTGGNMLTNATNTMALGGTINMSSASVVNGFTLPTGSGANPTSIGVLSFDSAALQPVFGSGSSSFKLAFLSGSLPTDGDCAKWSVSGTTASLVDALASCGGTAAFSSLLGGANTSAAMQNGTGSSLSPLNIGQVAGNQVWMQPAIPSFSGTFNQTGGSFSNGPYLVQVVYNSALGASLPSIEESSSSSTYFTQSCVSGTSCSITISAITVPSGYTSWTAYTTAINGASGTELLASSCQNISSGSGCTITAPGSGAAVPTTNGAIPQPPNVQATECPPSVIPTIFMPDNSGNYRTWAGVDPNSNNGQTSGTFDICHRTWFTDEKATPPGGNNGFVIIDHLFGTGTSTSNQDRALWVGAVSPANDSATRYAEEGIQSELDFNCNGCTINGSPDGEVTDASFNTTETAATNYTSPSTFGANVIRASYFKQGAGAGGKYSVLNAGFTSNNSSYPGGAQVAIVRSGCSGTMTAAFCLGFLHSYNSSTTNVQAALYVPGGQTPGGSNNYLILNETAGIPSILNGVTTVAGLNMNNLAQLPVTASVNVTGSVTTTQPTMSSPASVACTGGSSTYAYEFVGVDENGGTVASTQSSCTTGVNPLTSGNPATVSSSGVTATLIAYASFVRIDVYRISGPMATGKIGSLTCVPVNGFSMACNAFSDTGLSASGTVPTSNTTGGVVTPAAAISHLAGNLAQVGSAGFTTAANTSLQTITGLTFNLSPAAANYSFHCALSYSQATGTAAVAFGIQAASNAPTNVFAMGGLGTSATAGTSGVLPTLNTTTATAIVSGTPSATATNYTAVLDGTIGEPAATNGNAINFMVSTATSGDAVTVLRGSYCMIY